METKDIKLYILFAACAVKAIGSSAVSLFGLFIAEIILLNLTHSTGRLVANWFYFAYAICCYIVYYKINLKETKDG